MWTFALRFAATEGTGQRCRNRPASTLQLVYIPFSCRAAAMESITTWITAATFHCKRTTTLAFDMSGGYGVQSVTRETSNYLRMIFRACDDRIMLVRRSADTCVNYVVELPAAISRDLVAASGSRRPPCSEALNCRHKPDPDSNVIATDAGRLAVPPCCAASHGVYAIVHAMKWFESASYRAQHHPQRVSWLSVARRSTPGTILGSGDALQCIFHCDALI